MKSGSQEGIPLTEKIGSTLEKAGSAIFATSMTDFCAFLVGMYTTIPALKAFSVYAAVSVLFDFVYQVSLSLVD